MIKSSVYFRSSIMYISNVIGIKLNPIKDNQAPNSSIINHNQVMQGQIYSFRTVYYLRSHK